MNNILGSGYNKLTGEFRCIKKYYDRNIIYGYDLIDVNGKITFAHSSALKEALSTNAVSIDNIKLTSDGRILANVPEDREKFNKVVGNRGAKPSTTKVSRGPSKGCMIVNSFNICDNTIVINNQRVDRNDVIRKAVQTKTGILGLSVCADINCCFNTNDYFEMYTKLSKVFIKIHRELWRNCVSNSITDKIVDYHKSL